MPDQQFAGVLHILENTLHDLDAVEVGQPVKLTAGEEGDPELPFCDRTAAVQQVITFATQSWATGKGRKPIICVHGSKGIGKSTILQRAAAALVAKGVPCIAITYNFTSKGPDKFRRQGIGARMLWRYVHVNCAPE